MKYRRLVTEVEALQYHGDFDEVQEFCHDHGSTQANMLGRDLTVWLWVNKSQAMCQLNFGDYVVAEGDGDGVYPNARAIFEANYVPEREDDGASLVD